MNYVSTHLDAAAPGPDFVSLLQDVAPVRSIAEERLHRKQRLAATFRLFARHGFDQGLAGHVTARDPEHTDSFWVNPLGRHFGQMRVRDLIRVDHTGAVVERDRAAFAIRAAIHARGRTWSPPRAHSTYGKAWSTPGRLLDPLTQDSCKSYGAMRCSTASPAPCWTRARASASPRR